MKENQERENNELTQTEAKEGKKSSWKTKIWLLLLIFVMGGFVFYQFLPQSSLKSQNEGSILDIFSSKGLGVGDLAPDLVSEDVDGNKIALSDFQNKKPVLLIFWATWCGYCAKELPDLKSFSQKHQDEIQVIAVDSGEPKETIRDYIQKEKVNFLMLVDEQRKIWNQYLVRGTPSHFLIDKQGKIITLRPGLASLRDLEIMLTMIEK